MIVTIEVIKTPAGPAPEKVREKQVGVQMPAEPLSPDDMEEDFANGKIFPSRGGFRVDTITAIRALQAKSLAAAYWFQERTDQLSHHLSFGPDEVKVVN